MRTRLAADVYSVFWREMKRFWLQKPRIVVSVIQPAIWLGLMGNLMGGLLDKPMAAAVLGTGNYLSFMTAGVMVMTTLFGGVFGGVSIIWDRRLGLLNKMLAAPIARAAIPVGKALAVAVQTSIQVALIALVARLLGVAFVTGPAGVLMAIGIAALFSVIMSSLSLILAARLKSHEALFAVVNFLTMPLMFTSNAMFPTQTMPGWLRSIAAYNPVSYAVRPMRQLVTGGWDWTVLGQDAAVVAAMAALMVILAVLQYRKMVA